MVTTYKPENVKVSFERHKKGCSYKNKEYWVDITNQEYECLHNLSTIETQDFLFGDYVLYLYTLEYKPVAKASFSYGEWTYKKYVKEGVGEDTPCDCGMVLEEIKGFAEDSVIRIERKEKQE